MRKKNFLSMAIAIFAVVTCMTSCKQLYYQVYDVKSNSLNQQDNSLVYENEDLKVMYNLWGENGAVGFILQNKTDKDIFVDMDRTFFILNGEANDYFKNREYTTTTATTTSDAFGVSQSYLSNVGYWPTRYNVPTTVSGISKIIKGHSNGVTTKEKPVICIPANSFKVIDEYKVSPNFVLTCNSKTDYPHTSANVANYSESNSPVKFKNRIAYSFDKNVNNIKEIENDFYVNAVTNYSKKSAVEKKKEETNCYNKSKVKREYFKIGGPNKFYKRYVKSATGGSQTWE